ncbi:MAG: ABC transporter ATP-binding protein [Alphaproteobacteria bacterium]|nr:ABC transporter ATP-binding protein [Alphaproteobacteria bacterium]
MGVVAGGTATNAWLMQPVLDKVFVEKDTTVLGLIAGVILAVALARALASYGQAAIMSEVGMRIVAAIQARLFGHFMRADLAWFHANASGKLISSFLVDAGLLRDAVARALTGLAKDALTVVFLIGLLFWQDWKLASVMVLVLPPALGLTRRFGRRMRKASTRAQEESGTLTALLSEHLQGARMIKAFGLESQAIARTKAAIESRLHNFMKLGRTRAAASPSMEALGYVAVAAVVMYGGAEVIAGRTTPGTFFSFIAALLMAFQPLRSLASMNASLQEGLAAAQRVFAQLDTVPGIRDAADARPLVLGGGAIRFEGVGFTYADGRRALDRIDLDVPAGKTVALVGPSGAGKSTLLNLVPRFYDPDEGRVTIDGQDVRKATLASVRGAIALVSQDTTLFDDSVQANIALGRLGASADEIVAAAKAAAAHDFILGLPKGYDTVIGEGGVALSGGQRQRLAIARAVLKNAPILLLDEATSALDTEAERQVQGALDRLMVGRTTVVVAHRLSTVTGADRICVLDGGRVIESGAHRELLARGGLYARLWALQGAEDGGAQAGQRARA